MRRGAGSCHMLVSYVDVPAATINLCTMLYSGLISSGASTSPASIWSAVTLDPYSCRFSFTSTVTRPPVQAEQSVVELSTTWLTYLAQDHMGRDIFKTHHGHQLLAWQVIN